MYLRTLSKIILLCFFICGASPVHANGFLDNFIDPDDGNLDVSDWLLKQKGFLPVPIIITEPAVGYGAGAAILFFHESNRQQSPTGTKPKKVLPPSISGFAAAVTENDTWFGAAFHSGSYKQDTIRYLAGYIHPSINLKFYGGGDSPISSNGVDYNLKGDGLIQELMFRIPNSDVFMGGRLVYFEISNTFNNALSGIENWELESKNLGAGLSFKYDSRDNIFTPNSGWLIDAQAMWFDGSAVRDYSYQQYSLHPRYFWQVNHSWIVGLRAQVESTSGTVPFYALPFIKLRGIPAMRYQGSDVLTSEVEVRWNINYRWSVVGFTGAGTVSPFNGSLGDGPNYWARGLGIRYLTAKKMGLYTGIDVASGPEETAFYIQVGSAWVM